MKNHDQNQDGGGHLMATENKFDLDDVKDKLHVIEENGDIYKLDFDKLSLDSDDKEEDGDQDDPIPKKKSKKKKAKKGVFKSSDDGEPPTNKKKDESDMAEKEIEKTEDIEDVEDIEGVEDTDEVAEDVEDVEEETEETTELDMLREKALKLDALEKELEAEKAEKESLKTDMGKLLKNVDTIMKEREAEQDKIRNEKIKTISKDFQIPSEDLSKEALADLLEKPTHDKILDFAESLLSKTVKREEQDFEEDVNDLTDAAEALRKQYKIQY